MTALKANTATATQLRALRRRDWNEDIGKFDSLIVLPTRRKHDSGFRCMEFIAVRGGEAICRLGGGSDVVHIDGISPLLGVGLMNHGHIPGGPRWCFDCLPKSGFINMFNANGAMTVGGDYSSLEIFSCRKEV